MTPFGELGREAGNGLPNVCYQAPLQRISPAVGRTLNYKQRIVHDHSWDCHTREAPPCPPFTRKEGTEGQCPH